MEGVVAVRIPATSAARTEALLPSPILHEDYGSFGWWLMRPSEVATIEAEGVDMQVIDHPYVLTLGEMRFDPLSGDPILPSEWSGPGRQGPDLRLIQAVAPLRSSWLGELRALGLEPVQYIHPFSYVVWGSRPAIDATTALSWVRWSADFVPAYKVLPQWREPNQNRIDIDVLVPSIADPPSVIGELESLGANQISAAPLNGTWTVVSLSLPQEVLITAAAVPGVYSIQPMPVDGGIRGEMSNQVCADNVNQSNAAFPGYQTWLNTLDLNGDGVVMANVDQGADQNHPDLAGRFLACVGTTCGGDISSSHGTHTAAIQAATGNSGASSYGFLRALGMAPEARLVEQLYSPFYTQPDGMMLLIGESHANGASLSSNSWGPSGSPRGYDNDTMQTDIGVRDADPITPGNQGFTYVLSIMNGYGGISSQGTPDEAKNLITVGSTRMQTAAGSQFLDINNLSTNTAHGPALDGRLIPHLVAPGCRVDSAVPSGHGLLCGTSMASPHVSGAAALLVEQWRRVHGVDPSPAMIKAELIATAHDLAGNLDADGVVLGHVFDSKQGWGRLDAAVMLDPADQKAVFDAPVLLTETGGEWIHTLAIDNAATPVRAMLVWTDAPGHGLGGSTPAWNNDLDLIVEAGGLSYPGNAFDGDGWSVPGFAADGMNNTEGVFLPPATADEITLRVRASNLASDGVPDNPYPTDQDFAVIVTNAIQAPCEPGSNFQGALSVTDLVIAGAQGFALDWPPATTRCGGELTYTVNDSRLGEPGTPLISTTETAINLFGGAPGSSHCFTVGSRENGSQVDYSRSVCITGSGLRRAGDLDCDAALTTVDLELVIATIFGAAEPACAGYPAADANLDGTIDAADPAQLVRTMHDPL